jgi:hypothetical protein
MPVRPTVKRQNAHGFTELQIQLSGRRWTFSLRHASDDEDDRVAPLPRPTPSQAPEDPLTLDVAFSAAPRRYSGDCERC